MTLLRGYTAEAEDAYADALALVKDHGEVPQIFPVLRSLGSFHGFRGEFAKAIGLRERDPPARRRQGRREHARRRLRDARRGHRVRRAARDRPRVPRPGDRGLRERRLPPRRFRLGTRPAGVVPDDVGVLPLAAGLPGSRGRAGRSRGRLATEIDHPYSLAYAYYHAGFLHLWRREPEIVGSGRPPRSASPRRAICRSGGRSATVCWAPRRARSADPTEGIRQIADGLDQYHGPRTPPVFWPMSASCRPGPTSTPGARPRVRADRRGPRDRRRRRDVAPLFHIVRGDLSMLGSEPDTAAATASTSAHSRWRRDSARGCRSSERPCGLSGRRRQGSVQVGWTPYERSTRTFTEGFETRDLVEATELLAI